MSKILLGVNVLNHIRAEVYTTHMCLSYRLGRDLDDDFFIFAPPRMSIDMMRNNAAKICLEQNLDYLMFVDDDVVVEPNLFKQLRAVDADIVASHHYIRGKPFKPMFFKWIDDSRQNMVTYDDFKQHATDNVLDVAAVGFSAVLIKVDLLRKLSFPFFATFPNMTEDVYFCLKAQKEAPSTSIKVNLDAKTGHLADPPIIHANTVDLYRVFHKCELKTIENPDRGQEYVDMLRDAMSKYVNT